MPWPSDIPADLDRLMDWLDAPSIDAGEWFDLVTSWLDEHKVTLPSSARQMMIAGLRDLDERRSKPVNADRWGAIKECLDHFGVEVPDTLPGRPEIGGAEGRYG